MITKMWRISVTTSTTRVREWKTGMMVTVCFPGGLADMKFLTFEASCMLDPAVRRRHTTSRVFIIFLRYSAGLRNCLRWSSENQEVTFSIIWLIYQLLNLAQRQWGTHSLKRQWDQYTFDEILGVIWHWGLGNLLISSYWMHRKIFTMQFFVRAPLTVLQQLSKGRLSKVTVVQEDNCPRDSCPRNFCPRRFLSK